MIILVNLRKIKPSKPYDIIIDRRSVLGNPFFMNYENERNYVCDKYKFWFKEQIKSNNKIKNELNRLKNILLKYGKLRLFCWCTPKRCHGETIKKYLLQNKD